MRELHLKKSNLEFINLLKRVDKFNHFEEQDIQSFLDVGKFREYDEDEVIIKTGDLDSWVYLLLKGVLVIEKDNHHIGTLRRCGDMFGEMGAIDGSPRSATIRAKTKTLLLSFDSSVIEQSLQSGKLNFCYLVYRLFSEFLAVRLRNTTEEVVHLKKKNIDLKNKLNCLASKSSDTQIPFYEDTIILGQKRILIVDAVEATRKILRSIMRELKFKDVFVSDSVSGALRILQEEEDPVDIIVSDWQLASRTGLDLLKEVRSNEKLSQTPFILLVNESEADKVDIAVSLNVNEYLVKPVNVNMIHEKIKAVMSL